MSDKINNLLLTDTATPTSVVKINEQGVKETPSLFDSLLSSVISKETNGEISTTLTTKNIENPHITIENQNQEDIKVDIATEQIVVNKSEIKEVTVEEKKEDTQKINNTTSSLLDKLVIEAKKDLEKTSGPDVLLNKIDQAVVVPEIISVEEPIVVDQEEIKTDISKITADTIIPSENEVLVSNIETISVIKNEELSLMDKLIQKTTEKIVTTNITNDIITESSTKQIESEDLITNIYLGSQKNQFNNQSLFNKKEAVTLLKEGSSVEAIKVSAEMLELGLENIDIQQTKDNKLEIKKTSIDVVDRKKLIENLLAQKNVKSDEIKNLITQSVEASKALLENELTLAEDGMVNVNSPLSYNIQSKIIGARQQMATMMSDIARQMYENYKPPVTAFRINLNPTELGSIAILMKNDKNSGLSISMNVSNSVTLDTLIENQNVLKNSLNKTFNENTKFDLDFTSSNENGNNQSSNSQDNQQNNRRFEQQIDTQSILQLQEENKDREEKVIDYM